MEHLAYPSRGTITSTDRDQTPRHDAHHVVQETVRSDIQIHMLTFTSNGYSGDFANGMTRLALCCTKTLKVMLAHQHLRRLMHALGIKGLTNPGDAPGFHTRPCCPVQDRIPIRTLEGCMPGMKIIGNFGCPMHGNRFRQMTVDAKGPRAQRSLHGGVEMYDLGQCVNTGVRATRAMHHDGCARDRRKRGLYRLLDRGTVRLALPAAKGAAVVFDGERYSRDRVVQEILRSKVSASVT